MDSQEILEKMGDSVSRKIKKLSDLIRLNLTAAFSSSNLDITSEMYSVLRCLWVEDGLNQQTLAEKSFKEKANLAKIVDNLERRKLITRNTDNADRRNKLVFLTTEGKTLEDIVMPIAKKVILDAENTIDAGQLLIAKQVMDELLKVYQ